MNPTQDDVQAAPNHARGFEEDRDRLRQELTTCRAALDKTAIERDGFHGELVAARGQVIRLGLQLQDAMKAVAVARAFCEHFEEFADRLSTAAWRQQMKELCKTLPEPPKEM